MTGESETVLVGRVSGLFGVRGWVKVYSHTVPPEGIFEYPEWLLGEQGKPCKVAETQRHGAKLIARLDGVTDRDAAAELVGQDIAVLRSALPALTEDEFYWADLIGLAVETVQGTALGRVENLAETGAHDVLVVRGDRERLIPFVRGEIVTDVDLAAGLIRVDWDAEF